MNFKKILRIVASVTVVWLLALTVGLETFGVDEGTALIKGTALIIVGEFRPDWYVGRIARNIAAEAASDFEKLGYKIRMLFYDQILNRDMVINEIRRIDTKALVIIAHGNRDGFSIYGDRMWIGYADLPPFPSVFDYVILHCCGSYTGRFVFGPYTKFFKGHGMYTILHAAFLWQWLLFPSSGPHHSEYELIDIGRMEELSPEEAAAMPLYGEEFDIPDNAEHVAKEAFIQLTMAHNDLIEGYKDTARSRIQAATGLLDEAYKRGWYVASDLAGDLSDIILCAEPGDDFASACLLYNISGEPYFEYEFRGRFEIEEPGDRDFFRLFLPDSYMLSIEVVADQLGSYLNPYLCLYDEDGSPLKCEDDSGDSLDPFLKVYLGSGTYFIEVRASSLRFRETGFYELHIKGR